MYARTCNRIIIAASFTGLNMATCQSCLMVKKNQLQISEIVNTFVSVERLNEPLSELADDVIDVLKHLDFKRVDDFHISLSRTFVLRHHWIEPLAASLKKELKLCKRYFYS